ncbi:hypothetical protein [Pontiella agarivorans]|uniref:Uncharacterized protein n=1 Tax=Pontiella agarivorans TaxID=3038953 RepID=A0ABU5MX73_9BACT|nr:hypothetical protein [Pontiella agarivorans]MDZ8118681.1 hypothetical protein [Pontiella agarivorans]
MTRLEQSRNAWGTPEFEAVFKAELPTLGNALPLQQGLAAGSFSLTDSVEVMIIRQSADADFIRVKAGLFYESLTPGCACAGDPTVESEQNEHVTVLVSINRTTAEAVFQVLDV